MATRIRFLSSYLLLLLLLLLCLIASCWLNNVHAFDIRENHFHSLQISSLLPENHVCTRSTKGSNNRKASVEVFNSHGPCSPQYKPNGQRQAQPSLAEILSRDQSRVDSIKARLAVNSDKLKNEKLGDQKTTLPAEPGTSLGATSYFVTIGIGTPQKQLSLVFDTGSDITWTQCKPCLGSCYPQEQEKIDPAKSTTYKNITCESHSCSELKSATGVTPGCSDSTCIYSVLYVDKTFSDGYFAKDRVTLTSKDVLDDILFGCGQYNRLIGESAGLIGLGRHPLSIVSQTAAIYKKFFSYCLPTENGSGGHLTFGNDGVPGTVKYTPFTDSRGASFYAVTTTAISVGGQKLPISSSVLNNPEIIIDSGTFYSRLPSSVYKPLRDAFRKQMTMYKMVEPYSFLDTCYDLRNHTSVKVPVISFYFSGNVKVDVVSQGTLIRVNGAAQVCLAFAEDDSLSLFGHYQQQTLEVVYDVAGGKLGFAPNGCS